jgi:ankyrin repeat protein
MRSDDHSKRLRTTYYEGTKTAEAIANALSHACRGGQRCTAAYLLHRGADLNCVGHNRQTPLDAAQTSGRAELLEFLRTRPSGPSCPTLNSCAQFE